MDGVSAALVNRGRIMFWIATEGFLASIFKGLGSKLKAPDHSTLSIQGATLAAAIRVRARQTASCWRPSIIDVNLRWVAHFVNVGSRNPRPAIARGEWVWYDESV